MPQYTIDQYKKMAKKFNSHLLFITKMRFLIAAKEVLTLASDGNYWGVRVKDKAIQEQFEDENIGFEIEREWGSHEMDVLISLLGIDNTDL